MIYDFLFTPMSPVLFVALLVGAMVALFFGLHWYEGYKVRCDDKMKADAVRRAEARFAMQMRLSMVKGTWGTLSDDGWSIVTYNEGN